MAKERGVITCLAYLFSVLSGSVRSGATLTERVIIEILLCSFGQCLNLFLTVINYVYLDLNINVVSAYRVAGYAEYCSSGRVFCS